MMKGIHELCLKMWALMNYMEIVNNQKLKLLRTKLGEMQGVRRTIDNNKTVHEFLKIPYAKAPVGDLRFKKPKPFGKWSGILDAKEFGPSCFQTLTKVKEILPNKNISEDCLHLNIYVPGDVFTENNKSVMIWIHGGGYVTGQASLYDGAYLAITGDVIVVTVQYRLGVFGFFSQGVLKGNYGLWDQIMAIKWIKDNIVSFGGNNESITIFGESAGGFSVALLSIIPQNQGLFQRVILQSGTAISPYTISKERTSSEAVSENLRCTSSDTLFFESCLQNQTADELLVASSKYMFSSSYFHSPFAPVVDGELLKNDPKYMLENKESEGYKFYSSLDIVVGTVSGEASLLLNFLPTEVQSFLRFNLTLGIPKRLLCDVMAPNIATVSYMKNDKISKAICEYYGSDASSIGMSRNVLNTFSDFAFYIPAVETLDIHSVNDSNKSKRYQYIFSRSSPIPIGTRLPTWFDGAEHGSEVVFLFSNFLTGHNDSNLAIIFMKYWAHFAKTGNMDVIGLPQWREYDKKNRHYLNFDVPISSGQHLYYDRVKFWLTNIPAILNHQISSGFNNINENPLHIVLLSLVASIAYTSMTSSTLFG